MCFRPVEAGAGGRAGDRDAGAARADRAPVPHFLRVAEVDYTQFLWVWKEMWWVFLLHLLAVS